MTPTNARGIVEEVLTPNMAREIWTGNYYKALPISIQDFDLSAILPAVFFMFRFGHRRGKGTFLETFGPSEGTPRARKRETTVERIAEFLAAEDSFVGFEESIEKAILGDLLLCYCLDNVKNSLGRQEQVQRVAPAHYLANWLDLPDHVAHLRFVPEMIVAMLADQDGEYVQHSDTAKRTWFAVGQGFEKNVLLSAFNKGVVRRGELGSRTADQFAEESEIGLDQLLMVRLAQQLGAAPDKLRGGEGERISNQRPIAEAAARQFSEDIRRFVRSYAGIIPRQAFVKLLESCVSVGMTAILTSSIEILLEWEETGKIRKRSEQEPTFLFVDCSNGVDRRLRWLAEQSMDDFIRRVQRFPVVMMALRLLDHKARYNRRLKLSDIPTKPYATEWLNLLGDLLFNRHREADYILRILDDQAEELAEKLEDDYPEAAELLRHAGGNSNPVWPLSEALTMLRGRRNAHKKTLEMIDSTLLIDRPNGLASKRRTTRNVAGARSTRDTRSLVFTDSVLEYLVHLHVIRNGNKRGARPLSFREFISTLHQRYGFCVDVSPPGITASNDLLQTNRTLLEKRLRDLGLFVGVNDAETMKRLKPRFHLALEG